MAAPTLRQLRAYLAIVEAGSVSLAARSLGLTQPALSQQLRELERLLGLRLLDRAGGRSLPTAAGQALLGPARQAIEAAEAVSAAAARHRGGLAGRVRLGTGASACIHLLPPVLAAVKRAHPGLEIVVATGNSAEMVRRVEEGAMDLALVTLPAGGSRALQVTRLRADPQLALLPEAMAPAAAALRPAELARLPLILYESGGTSRRLVDAWFARAGLAPRPLMELGSVEAIKGLVAGGLGASVVPSLAVPVAPPGTVLRPLRPALPRELGLVLRREKIREHGLRVLLEGLQALRATPPVLQGQGEAQGEAPGATGPASMAFTRRPGTSAPGTGDLPCLDCKD